MISYEDALTVIAGQSEPLSPVTKPAQEVLGMICAQSVTSEATVPPFANSAMDGFAVRSAMLVASASPEAPLRLPVIGSTVAGDLPSQGTEGAWEIMTGAPVPEGYDAVIKIEDVKITKHDKDNRPTEIAVSAPVTTGQNIRKAGEDIRPGDAILNAGDRISPTRIMALATVGKSHLPVYPKPRVTVISTGKEIIDDPAIPLKPGQIRNSNSPYLLSMLEQMNAAAGYAGIIHDEPEIFENRMRDLLPQADVIISTGAVSAGRHDFIPESLRRLGAEILFHKVAIRPGKPILYARFPNGAHYFGLPGNPVSAAVGLRFFVAPLLRQITGQPPETPLAAILESDAGKKPDLCFFQKAFSYLGGDQRLYVRILPGQESFKIHPLLEANCWAVLPAGTSQVRADTPIGIVPLQPEIFSLSGAPHADYLGTVRRLQAVRG